MAHESERPQGPFAAIRSELADDPDISQIVELFVEEMPRRVEQLRANWRGRDLESLRLAAQQLKGASAEYGFPTVELAAGKLEDGLIKLTPGGQAQLDNLRQQFDELVDLCRRVSAE